MDTNKDGKLSRGELASGIAFLQPRRRPSDFVFMLIEMSDLDENTTIEVQRAYDILRTLDRNRDGRIDTDELKAGRERIVNNRVDFLFKQLDTNNDGRISREEAKGMVRQNFKDIDRNGDRFIEREEMTQAILAAPPVTAPDASSKTPPPPKPQDR
jgi:Ca2+-binding EF-hand superfamily protein